MKFTILTEIEIKNDALTRDADAADLAGMILENLAKNGTKHLPWVIGAEYTLVTSYVISTAEVDQWLKDTTAADLNPYRKRLLRRGFKAYLQRRKEQHA